MSFLGAGGQDHALGDPKRIFRGQVGHHHREAPHQGLGLVGGADACEDAAGLPASPGQAQELVRSSTRSAARCGRRAVHLGKVAVVDGVAMGRVPVTSLRLMGPASGGRFGTRGGQVGLAGLDHGLDLLGLDGVSRV